MAQNFETERKALLAAVQGKKVNPADYAGAISLKHGPTGSANHKMQANPTWALDGIRSGKRKQAEDVLDWAEGYYLKASLHENEDLTPNVAYRGAITNGTYVLAGIAHELGRHALSNALLDRCRSDIYYLILGAGTGAAREIQDMHLDRVGEAFLYIGAGRKKSAVPGLPYIAQAGKRGHVRGGGHANHIGPLEDTLGLGVSTLVAHATGIGKPPKYMGELFRAILSRWPGLVPYGFSERDRALARAFLANPLEALVAQEIAHLAGKFRPSLPFAFIRYSDGAIASVCWESDDSSTGCRQVDVLFADGTHYIGSADTASRGTERNKGKNVQPQRCIEQDHHFRCEWKSGEGRVIVVPKPMGEEVYRVEIRADRVQYVPNNGSPVAPTPTEPLRPEPAPRHRVEWP